MIYFLKPKISGFTDKKWKEFYKGAFEVLKKFKPHKITEIDSLDGFSARENNPNNLLIYFVPVKETNGKIRQNIEKVLRDAVKNNWKVYPIAPDKENRFPSQVIDTSQSYDIINEINQRKLNGDYFYLIGKCFARVVIVSYFTASFKKETKIFLSHKRKDGEDTVNLIKKVANNRHEKIYIDLHEITVGENAQEEINKKLKNDTDILIFLQTSTSFESEYQLIELKRALELDIPILWVTLGFEEGDKTFTTLPIHPVGNPHLSFKTLDNKKIQEILSYAFEILSLKKQSLLKQIVYKLESLESNGVEYRELCDLENIYLIARENKDTLTGEIEIMNTLYKFLCRKYQENDSEIFDKYNKGINNYGGNQIFGTQKEEKELPNRTKVKNYEKLFNVDHSKKINGGIIISGSFPDNLDLKHQQDIINAISTIVQDILKLRGKIIFGIHPTFQGLVLEKAKKYKTPTKKNVTIYASKCFRNFYKTNLNYFYENAEVIEIEEVSSDKKEEAVSLSLTKMRKAMTNDNEAIAMIVIGGKEAKDSLTKIPGIDEEIKLAKAKGLPVFVIGSTGGRSATIISEGYNNPITDEYTRNEVDYGDNYRLISKIILNELS